MRCGRLFTVFEGQPFCIASFREGMLSKTSGVSAPSVIQRAVDRCTALCLFTLSSVGVRVFGISAAYWLTRRFPARKRRTELDVARLVSLIDGSVQLVHHASWCLSRSLALTLMMRLRGVPAHLVLGLRPIPLMGHAWVEVGGEVVNDDSRVLKFYRRLDVL